MQGLPREEGNTPRGVFCLMLEGAVFTGTVGTPRFRLLSVGAKGQPLTQLVVLHTHTHGLHPGKHGLPPLQLQEKEGVPCLLRKHSCVSVTSAHHSGVRRKPGTYRDKGLAAPPAGGSTEVTRGLVSAGVTGLELVHQQHSTCQ